MDRKKHKTLLSAGVLYLVSFLIPVYIMSIILYRGGFYPFGDKTLFTMDMRDEYLEFFAYLRNLTGGDNSFFFCWSRSMGGNFLGLYAYYLANPLSFLVCLFPVERMDAAITFLTVLKIGLCGISFAGYANYLWKYKVGEKAESRLAIWLFSSCYALLSYNMVYLLCLMWLDGVIFLPMVLLGVEKILDGKKGFHYLISLVALFVCNYYTGYMVGIFTALYFLYRLVCKMKKRSIRNSILWAGRFFSCTLLAIGMSAPLLLPVGFDLMKGKLSDGGRYQLSFESNFLFSEFMNKFKNGSYDSITDSGLPSVYCGIVVLVLAIAFIFCHGVSLREKIGAILLLGLLTASFYYKGLNLVWHGFRAPVWFPYRYSFLFSFTMIYMAFNALCSFFLDCGQAQIKNIGNLVKVKYGALAVVFIFTVTELSANGQALICGVEEQFGYAKGEDYRSFLSKSQPLVEWIQRQDEGLFRINATYEFSKNDAMLLGYNGMTHYSSTYNRSVNDLTRRLGIAQAHFWNSGYGASPVLDSLFAVSYKLSDRHEPIFYEQIYGEGKGVTVYRNTLALPMIYATKASTMEPELEGQENPYRNQNVFLNALAGKQEQYFRELTYTYFEQDKGWGYTLTADSTDPIYLYMSPSSFGWADVYVNDVWYGNYFSSETTCSLYVGSYEPGEQVTIRVEPSWEGIRANSAVIASLDMGVLQTVLEELRTGGMDISEHKGGKLKGTIFVQEGQVVMTSIPYDEGWTVWVDGQKVETMKFADTFLAVPMCAGEHEIYFSYISPGFYSGMGIFFITIIMALFYFYKAYGGNIGKNRWGAIWHCVKGRVK